MNTPAPVNVGDQIRDGLGHWYLVMSGGPWCFKVQPLTWVGHPAVLREFGHQFTMGRSDMRTAGE